MTSNNTLPGVIVPGLPTPTVAATSTPNTITPQWVTTGNNLCCGCPSYPGGAGCPTYPYCPTWANTGGTTTLPTTYPITYTPITTTISLTPSKYDIFIAPKTDIPIAVYLCGNRLTIGILGSDVQCAYSGSDKLIFAPDLIKQKIDWATPTVTLIIEYKKEIYNYNVFIDFGAPKYLPNSRILEAMMVSIIKKT